MRPLGANVNPTGWSSSATVTTRTGGEPPARAGVDGTAASAIAVAATPSVNRCRRVTVGSPRCASGSMTPVTTLPPSMFGVPALRAEDPRILTGRGRYVENLPIEGALRAVFVLSLIHI